MASLKSIQLLAGKLGVENQDKLVNKAAEFERLLQSKSLAGSSITDTGKVVICLDLAAMYYGVDLDVKTAVKYSGLKAPTYIQCRKIIENLLELNTGSLSISSVCLSLQCVGAQVLAESILKDYKSSSKMSMEMDLPQYVCMAVHQACRLKKIKVPKAKLIDKARLKPAQWAKLDGEWTKFVDVNFGPSNKKASRASKTILEDENIEKMEVDHDKVSTDTEEQAESYKDWKKRILTSAYAELKTLEKQTPSKPNLLTSGININEIEARTKTTDRGSKTIDSGLKTIDSGSKAIDSGLKTIDSGSKAIDSGSKTIDSGSKTVDSRLVLTPQRRSPRKIPLKFSPYKVADSQKKSQTVRLLFPL